VSVTKTTESWVPLRICGLGEQRARKKGATFWQLNAFVLCLYDCKTVGKLGGQSIPPLIGSMQPFFENSFGIFPQQSTVCCFFRYDLPTARIPVSPFRGPVPL
jgi:hypothetical protein